MTQTRSRLSRVVGEFLTIVLGVLVALAVDNWNVDRQEAALGRDYVERIAADIMADTLALQEALEGSPERVEKWPGTAWAAGRAGDQRRKLRGAPPESLRRPASIRASGSGLDLLRDRGQCRASADQGSRGPWPGRAILRTSTWVSGSAPGAEGDTKDPGLLAAGGDILLLADE